MPNFIAIELKDGEHPHAIVGEFIHLADRTAAKFKEVETLGVTTLGTRSFLRCRTDSDRLYPFDALAEGLLEKGRGVAIPKGPGYEVQLPGGRTARVPSTVMQAPALPAQRVKYRGPRMKFWERQFLK